jgi:hypothetical protein
LLLPDLAEALLIPGPGGLMRRLTLATFGLLGVGLLAGCPDRNISEVNPNQDKEEFKDIPVQLNRDVDILFVIDNSGSMDEEQASLAANFPVFIERLETIEGGLPNVHLGVVSSDVGAGPFSISMCDGNGDNPAPAARPRAIRTSATSRTRAAPATPTTPAHSRTRSRASRASASPGAASSSTSSRCAARSTARTPRTPDSSATAPISR